MVSDPHHLPKSRILSQLHTNEAYGLSSGEVRTRLKRYGFNELEAKSGPTNLELVWRQINSPLIYILLVANAFSVYQREWTEVAFISAVIIINTLIGFFQERKAENVMARLRHILSQKARVIRQGVEEKLAARSVVPGDIIIVEAGDKVPADARILQARNLRVNQAPLTGESLPAAKQESTVAEKTALINRTNMLYSSTLVISGRAIAVVTATGMATEIGKISKEVSEVDEGLGNIAKQVSRIARYFLVASGLFLMLLLIAGLAYGYSWTDMVRITISLLVSVVPEGLPVAITVSLSVGLLRVFRKNALIRKLSAAETLGSTTVICVDKTGTITEGKLLIERLYTAGKEYRVDGEGYELSGHFYEDDSRIYPSKIKPVSTLLETISLATTSPVTQSDVKNDVVRELTDPTETALAVVAAKAGCYSFELDKNHPEVMDIPFDQDLRYSASIRKYQNKYRTVVKGSPERIVSLSANVLTGSGKAQRLNKDSMSKLEEVADNYASQGYRVVAIAYADLPKNSDLSDKSIKNLTFAGFVAMTDPIRGDLVRSLDVAVEAGLRVLMITGDHLKTAEAIAKRAGIIKFGSVIHADDLGRRNLSTVSAISRATPAQKLKIVERLQRDGQIVAMTGDGVNDAPALKKADIGISMGRGGTDVAIEASDMVLLKDSFSSIIEAIKQGRLIWENLRKIIYFLLSVSFAEIAIILVSVFLGLPLPLIAVQILWVNMVTSGINAMALTVEPEERNLMKQPPRSPKEPLMNKAMIWRMVLISVVMTIGVVGIYNHYLPQGVEYARTVALTTVVLFELFNLFNARSYIQSTFKISIKSNKLLVATLSVSILLQLAAIYLPFFSTYLRTVPISLGALLTAVAVATTILVADELRKLIIRRLTHWAKTQTN